MYYKIISILLLRQNIEKSTLLCQLTCNTVDPRIEDKKAPPITKIPPINPEIYIFYLKRVNETCKSTLDNALLIKCFRN